MTTLSKIYGAFVLLALASACIASPQTSTPFTPTDTPPIPKPSAPITVQLNGENISNTQASLSISVQTWVDSPMTLITVTLPAEIQLVQGELFWQANLSANEAFTKTLIISAQELPSIVSITLEADSVQPESYFGKIDRLYVRRTLSGFEFSHDPYFGAPPPTPDIVVATATSGTPTVIETPGANKPTPTQAP